MFSAPLSSGDSEEQPGLQASIARFRNLTDALVVVVISHDGYQSA